MKSSPNLCDIDLRPSARQGKIQSDIWYVFSFFGKTWNLVAYSAIHQMIWSPKMDCLEPCELRATARHQRIRVPNTSRSCTALCNLHQLKMYDFCVGSQRKQQRTAEGDIFSVWSFGCNFTSDAGNSEAASSALIRRGFPADEQCFQCMFPANLKTGITKVLLNYEWGKGKGSGLAAGPHIPCDS